MLSRVAESLYWMSRYLERAEDVARLVAVNFQAALDAPEVSDALAWEPIIRITGDAALFRAAFDEVNAAAVTHFLTHHPSNPNAILACVERARENARAVREQISREMWEQVNRLYHRLRATDMAAVARNPYDFFTEVRNGSHLFQGVTDATMAHSEGWLFIQAGKYLERADKTVRILDVKYQALADETHTDGSPIATLQWLALLKSCSAFEPYRRAHSYLQPWRVVDFLLLNATFPRSVAFCLEQTRRALGRGPVAGGAGERALNPAERALGRVCAELQYLEIRDALVDLHGYLDDLQGKVNHVGDAITQTYFTANLFPTPPTLDARIAQQQ